MAQSKSTSQPTKMWFNFSFEEGIPKYIDAFQALSMVSNKLHRQGQNLMVQNMTLHVSETGATDQAVIDIRTVPKTWIVDNATTKMYQLWQKQRRQSLEEGVVSRAKWSDFKVYLDAQHAALDDGEGSANLIPHNGMAPGVVETYQPGANSIWRYSEIVFPDPTGALPANGHEAKMHVVGDNANPAGQVVNTTGNVSIVRAYQQSRNKLQSPDPAVPAGYDDSFYALMTSHDDMSEDIIEETSFSNDEPPYNQDNYPFSNTNVVMPALEARLYPNNYGNTVTNPVTSASTGPFVAPLGLIKIEAPVISALNGVVVELDLMLGSSKGIMAERGY